MRTTNIGLARRTLFSVRPLTGWAALLLLWSCAGAAGVVAQTVIVISNPSFESPPPTVFPDYTVGATDWTRTRSDVDAGTFAPGLAAPPVTPAPIHGVQVGYANGSGGLQQVLATNFAAGYTYTFSGYIGYRSDEVNAPNGSGAMQLGYLDGASVFSVLAAQAAAPVPGQFNFVTGTYLATAGDQGRAIVVRLVDTASVQVLFDQVQLSVSTSAIPEPAAVAGAMGAVALAWAAWRRGRSRARMRSRDCG